jgi:Bacterial regulatory protein, arsR family
MLDSNLQRGNPHDDGHKNSMGEIQQGGSNAMAVVVPVPVQADWVKTMLFDRGYLSRIRGEAIKVYLVIIEACNGLSDRSVTISLSQLMKRTHLSCPTVIDSLAQLEELGLVASTTHERGKVKTYYVPGPAASPSA